MANMKRIGFGQVEPNHLSAQRNGKIYAQLPADAALTVIENGRFVKYDYAAGKVDLTGEGEWMLVFNEVKLYDDFWRESYKDFAMKKSNYSDGVMVPRVIKTNIGDIYTTNCIVEEEVQVGDKLSPRSTDGMLCKDGDGSISFQIVKIYTLADGQAAVKLMRVK